MNYYNNRKGELHSTKQQISVASAPSSHGRTVRATSALSRRHSQSSERCVTNAAKRIIRAQKSSRPTPPPKHSFLAAVRRRLNAPAPPIPAKRSKAAARTHVLLPLIKPKGSVNQLNTSSVGEKKVRVPLPPITHP